MSPFRFSEKYLSQIPALQLLMYLGFTHLPPEAALKERLGKQGGAGVVRAAEAVG